MKRVAILTLAILVGWLAAMTAMQSGLSSEVALAGKEGSSSLETGPTRATGQTEMVLAQDQKATKEKAAKRRVPRYKPPKVGRPWRTIGGATRSLSGPVPDLAVLAPHDHSGRTVEEQPTLYFYISGAPTTPVEFTLLDEHGVAPLVETDLTVGAEGGIQAVRLADHGVTLQPGQRYHWFIALIQDPEHRSKDVIAEAGIERVTPEGDLSEKLAAAQGTGAAFAYAEAGLWYDALAAITKLIAADPANAELRALRTALFEQVELDKVISGATVTTSPSAG